MNKFLKLAASIAVMGTTATFSTASRAAGDPGNFVLPQLFAAYGDGLSFGLQVSCSSEGFGSGANSCPYYVDSQAGQIKDLIVVATGSSGQGVTTNIAGMDDAYSTPSGQNPPPFFRTGGNLYGGLPSVDPQTSNSQNFVADFVGDRPDSWDTTLSSFFGFLNGSAPVMFFNNNQVNSGAASNQTLAIWAQVWVTGPGDQVLGVYDFTNRGQAYRSAPEGGGIVGYGEATQLPLASLYTSPGVGVGPGSYAPGNGIPGVDQDGGTDYVLAGGQNCLTAGTFPTGGLLVSCDSPLADRTVNNNLGANQAAYAVIFPELNALLANLASLPDLTGYALHADIRMGCDPTLTFAGDALFNAVGAQGCTGKSLNNGYEQIFIGRLAEEQRLPEPATLALLGLTVAGIGFARRATRKQH